MSINDKSVYYTVLSSSTIIHWHHVIRIISSAQEFKKHLYVPVSDNHVKKVVNLQASEHGSNPRVSKLANILLANLQLFKS